MNKRKSIKLLIAVLIIIVGGIFIRIAWFILSTFFILLGAGVFLGGVIYFSTILFNSKNK
jgi:hypothetical protein